MKVKFQLGSVENIIAIYNQATDAEKVTGEQWYTEAHNTANKIASTHGYPLHQVTGVIAAISPRNRWEKNVLDAENIIIADKAGLGFSAVKVSSFDKNKTKAFACLTAKNMYDVDDLMNAPKTTAFSRNIYDPTDDAYVTIDGHAYAISVGERVTLEECPELKSGGRYEKIVELYRQAALQVGVSASSLQAITWVTYRRIHGITK